MTEIRTISIKSIDMWEKAKEIARREGKSLSELINLTLEDYVKVHGDGNPVFTLDHFNDPNFMACPAFYRDSYTWTEYLRKADKNELAKVRDQIITIDKILGRYI
jgi:hypothetical protein